MILLSLDENGTLRWDLEARVVPTEAGLQVLPETAGFEATPAGRAALRQRGAPPAGRAVKHQAQDFEADPPFADD